MGEKPTSFGFLERLFGFSGADRTLTPIPEKLENIDKIF
jgi:hypothetical protein